MRSRYLASIWQYTQRIPLTLARGVERFSAGCWRRIKTLPHKLEPMFRFSSMWDNLFPSFLIGYLSFFRGFLTTPIFPDYTVLLHEPKDAFWIVNQIITTLRLDVVFSKLKDGWNWFASLGAVASVLNGLSIVYKWIAPALPYIPFVGLGISTCIAIKDFWLTENKNAATTFKFLADITGAVLLGVGLGLMKWGGAAAALYNAPTIIIAAAAVVATVGLVKMGYHFYLAYKNPKNRKQHIVNGLKETLTTLITVTASVLTLFGMQMGQQITNGFANNDLSFFASAGEIYHSAAMATNVVLAATGTLIVMQITPKIYAGYKKIRDKCFGARVEMPAIDTSEAELAKTKVDANQHITTLTSEVNQPDISSRLRLARQQKLNVLIVAQNVLQGDATTEDLLNAVTVAKKTAPATFGLYQSSFWKLKGKTQELVEKTLELSKPPIPHVSV